MSVKRPVRLPVPAIVALCALALAAPAALTLLVQRDAELPSRHRDPAPALIEGRPEAAVAAYLEARREGDAARACARLSKGQRFEVVAAVTGRHDVSEADCAEHVLETAVASDALRPVLSEFRERDLYVVRWRGRRMAFVSSQALDPAEHLQVIREGRRWLIDSQARNKVDFLWGCMQRGLEESDCTCVFEEIRRMPGGTEIFHDAEPTPETERLLRSGAEICGAPRV